MSGQSPARGVQGRKYTYPQAHPEGLGQLDQQRAHQLVLFQRCRRLLAPRVGVGEPDVDGGALEAKVGQQLAVTAHAPCAKPVTQPNEINTHRSRQDTAMRCWSPLA